MHPLPSLAAGIIGYEILNRFGRRYSRIRGQADVFVNSPAGALP
jgi:hypothetical protein